jgi:hypothetical protein
MLDISFLTSSFILLISCIVFTYFILKRINPEFILDNDKKINNARLNFVTFSISFIFTTMITIISYKIDKSKINN